MKLFVCMIALIGVTCADMSSVIVFNENNFDNVKDGNYFVSFANIEFGAFNSFYGKVSSLYNDDPKAIVKFAKVDCNASPAICEKEGIKKISELKLFTKDPVQKQWLGMKEYIIQTLNESLATHELTQRLKTGKYFASFCLPYCANCKDLSPVWEDLEKEYKDNSDVTVIKIDCKMHRTICDDYHIDSYAYLQWMEQGKAIEKFTGKRTLNELKEYVEKMVKLTPNVEKASTRSAPVLNEGGSASLDINAENFQGVIAFPDITLVKFYMPTCTYCQELIALWEPFALKVAKNEKIQVTRVDCNKNYKLCMDEAKGCPTLNVYQAGKLLMKDYHEDTTIEGLVDCVESYASGGQSLEDWKLRMKEKKRLRKKQEEEED